MPGGNSGSHVELKRRIERARDLLEEAIALLGTGSEKSAAKTASVSSQSRGVGRSIDFSIQIRAFVKKYASEMSGAKKFVLLVAYLTKGDSSKSVALAEIEKHWNKMTAKDLLGMKFNRLHSSRARENDWVATEKAGLYHLRPGWKDILG